MKKSGVACVGIANLMSSGHVSFQNLAIIDLNRVHFEAIVRQFGPEAPRTGAFHDCGPTQPWFSKWTRFNRAAGWRGPSPPMASLGAGPTRQQTRVP